MTMTGRRGFLVSFAAFVALSQGVVSAFVATTTCTGTRQTRQSIDIADDSRICCCSMSANKNANAEESSSSSSYSRRLLLQSSYSSFWAAAAATATVVTITPAAWADTGAEVRGTPVTPFNGLIFQYRGNDFGGLQASDLNEPSVSYKEFVERLQKGQVAFVEFMAPNGDAAYVTFKQSSGSDDDKQVGPIRIGEGYPIEQADGWSSPAFAVRTVKNAGVPYKFTVPALRAYNK